MLDVLVFIMAVSGIVFQLVGLLIFFLVFGTDKDYPMDNSNRINHLRLVWFALKSPQDFVFLYRIVGSEESGHTEQAFPWLMRDEGDNV